MSRMPWIAAMLGFLAGIGCQGAIEDAGAAGSPLPPGSGPAPGPTAPPGPGGGIPGPGSGAMPPATGGGTNEGAPGDRATVPGPAPLRRLTKVEYQNTVRDLLSVAAEATVKTLSADQDSDHSGFLRGGTLSTASDARAFMLAAEQLAQAAVQRLGSLLPCAPLPAAAAQDLCAERFIEQFGRRAFRRPITAVEVDGLRAVYRAQRSPPVSASFEEAVGALVSAILQSPQFLYRGELGAGPPQQREGQVVRLGPYEIASGLSYLIWASMPDEALFAAAAAGGLNTLEGIATQSRRMLADPRARGGMAEFFLQWLELGDLAELPKDPTAYPDWSPALARAMREETTAFAADLLVGPRATGKLETLLTGASLVVDPALVRLYGARDPSRRAGIFTQASFLTATADADSGHPFKRGDVVLRRLLCTELTVPPGLEIPPLPDPKPGQTTRERFALHSASPCAACHKLIDPVGFAFENYDAIGRWRAVEEGRPVDASGELILPGSTTALRFANAVQLVQQLASTREARDCLTTQWARYVLRRRELASEAPSLELARRTFTASGGDLRELVVALTGTRTFTHRALSAGEVLP